MDSGRIGDGWKRPIRSANSFFVIVGMKFFGMSPV